MPNYYSKVDRSLGRELKTKELIIPFTVTHNATPASKTIGNDEPSMVFTSFEGLNRITLADGAVDSAAELSALTFQTAADSTGKFSVLVRVGETVRKVLVCEVLERNVLATGERLSGQYVTGSSSGITSVGDKIVANFDSAKDFSAADLDAVLVVKYTV